MSSVTILKLITTQLLTFNTLHKILNVTQFLWFLYAVP